MPPCTHNVFYLLKKSIIYLCSLKKPRINNKPNSSELAGLMPTVVSKYYFHRSQWSLEKWLIPVLE